MIELDGVKKGELVAVAMSGGVDSSVAAALLVEAGYNVIGITLQLYDHGQMVSKKGSCCAGQDIYDAKKVADKLNFPHYVLDYESVFKQNVIDDFADSYLRGETPIPCIRCNQKVKFKDLLQTSKDLDVKALVTGHYVRRYQKETAEMHSAIDPNRDQSYFLFTTTQPQLDYLRFPLGGMHKDETRSHAERFGLDIAQKPDSQDICFVVDGSYRNVVEKLCPGALDAGDIMHIDGTKVGEHKGIINYTIGQRKGLNISWPNPLFVIDLQPETNRVIVGPKEALATHTIFVKETNWLADEDTFKEPFDCQVKIRSHSPTLKASIKTLYKGCAEITLETPEYGVAAGQACVFYNGTHVLGGGWITKEKH